LGYNFYDFKHRLVCFNNCWLQASIFRLPSFGCLISTTSSCKLQHFGFQASDVLFQQLLISSFDTSVSKPRLFHFNNCELQASILRLPNLGCIISTTSNSLLSASTAGDVTVFFYSEKKVTKKNAAQGLCPYEPRKGGAVRMICAYLCLYGFDVLPRGLAPP